MEISMKNISVRLSTTDIMRFKELSIRLGIRESDLLRFSIKHFLSMLVPLNDRNLRGAELMPIWLECGSLLLENFDLDSAKLNEIFNHGLDEKDQPIDPEDIEMMAMSKLNPVYLVKRLSAICERKISPEEAPLVLRNHLYEKYVVCSEKVGFKPDFSLSKTNDSTSVLLKFNNH
jgi:hypothetical protein